MYIPMHKHRCLRKYIHVHPSIPDARPFGLPPYLSRDLVVRALQGRVDVAEVAEGHDEHLHDGLGRRRHRVTRAHRLVGDAVGREQDVVRCEENGVFIAIF